MGSGSFFVLRKIMVSILRPFPYRKNIEKIY